MKAAARIFQALADPTRRQILQELKSGELAAGHLAARLTAEGNDLVVISRGTRPSVILRREDAEGTVSHMRDGSFAALRRLRMTVTDEGGLAAAFENCEVVAHCAGINREIGA